MTEINTDLILAKRITPTQWTWTITTRLGDALSKAESLFGERNKDFTILGVEFAVSDRPQIWYPGNRKSLVIQLTESALGNKEQALYQLSHEVVHCLSPTGLFRCNILEEGLATYFSDWYMKSLGHFWISTKPHYAKACLLAEQLLTFDKEIIKKVRKFEPVISNVTPDHLLFANSNINKKLAEKLCKEFYYK